MELQIYEVSKGWTYKVGKLQKKIKILNLKNKIKL